MKSLGFLVGKEVDIFNPQDTEAVDGLMATGKILSIADGWAILANPKTGEPDFAVNLAHVGMIAIREPGVMIEALPGGKVHRLHRPPGQEGGDREEEDEE